MIDTPLCDIEYGRPIRVIVNGRRARRHFHRIYCDACGALLKARLISSGPRAGQLYSSGAHNKRRVCDTQCQADQSRRYHARARSMAAMPGIINGWQIL